MKYFIYSTKILAIFILHIAGAAASGSYFRAPDEIVYSIFPAEALHDVIGIFGTKTPTIHPIGDKLSESGIEEWNERIRKESGVFNIKNNYLTAIPRDYLLFTNIRELNLSNNRLEDLPMEFTNLINLEILKANDNRFTAIPEVLYGMIGIKELEFANNHLEDLPTEFNNLINLEVLKANDNRFTEIPEVLYGMNAIKELEFENNHILLDIRELITNLITLKTSLTNLKKLSLLGNTPLEGVDIQEFSYSPTLKDYQLWNKDMKVIIRFQNGDSLSRSILKRRLKEEAKERRTKKQIELTGQD